MARDLPGRFPNRGVAVHAGSVARPLDVHPQVAESPPGGGLYLCPCLRGREAGSSQLSDHPSPALAVRADPTPGRFAGGGHHFPDRRWRRIDWVVRLRTRRRGDDCRQPRPGLEEQAAIRPMPSSTVPDTTSFSLTTARTGTAAGGTAPWGRSRCRTCWLPSPTFARVLGSIRNGSAPSAARWAQGSSLARRRASPLSMRWWPSRCTLNWARYGTALGESASLACPSPGRGERRCAGQPGCGPASGPRPLHRSG